MEGGTENRRAENPAKSLTGGFRSGSFCGACQHRDLANADFPYFTKQILSRGSFLQILPHFAHDSPITTLPSLALNSHCCSSSSLIPYLASISSFLSRTFPASSLSNHCGICTANLPEYLYFLRVIFFPHFYFSFEEEVVNNFDRAILALFPFQLLELPAGILLSPCFQTEPRAAAIYSSGFMGIHT